MTMPLTPDELQAVDRKVASLSREVADVALLLSSRYGEADELAALARGAQADFIAMSQHIHRMAMAAHAEASVTHRAQSA